MLLRARLSWRWSAVVTVVTAAGQPLANKFGIGVYNPPPALSLQLPWARDLTGDGGRVVLYVGMSFAVNGERSVLHAALACDVIDRARDSRGLGVVMRTSPLRWLQFSDMTVAWSVRRTVVQLPEVGACSKLFDGGCGGVTPVMLVVHGCGSCPSAICAEHQHSHVPPPPALVR